MSRTTLNLGILAHVDAGKTTLTERLLYDAGVIAELGSVDAGTTQTDTLALERQRGITIRSAVVSFELGDVTVDLIDTPGHPDFIAEVERVLAVLDGAVLVVSAVEGVQAQTRVLMRALQRLRIPTLLFVNKIDRPGADDARVLRAIVERLTPTAIPLTRAVAPGTREAAVAHVTRAELAEALAEHDEETLAAYVAGEPFAPARLAAAVARCGVQPVFAGSALTGAGVAELAAGVAGLLPGSTGDPEGPLACTVFKIERGRSGEKVAYVRVFSGTIRTRECLGDEKVTAIRVFERGGSVQRPEVRAGRTARLWGLRGARIGDAIGELPRVATPHEFARPTLETVVVPVDPDDRHRLRLALAQLAEQDPLIDVRQDERGELSVSLYGEVQKEVVGATLADDHALAVEFRETTMICIERPLRRGEALEVLHRGENPFDATLGYRVEPAAAGTGLDFRLAIGAAAAPLHLYGRLDLFGEDMARCVGETLAEGLRGWQVADCAVTLTDCAYGVADGPPSKRASSSQNDFRRLTPLVLMRALERAGTVVCEPLVRTRLELPPGALGPVLAAVSRLGGRGEAVDAATVVATLPADRVHDLQRQLPGLTAGEGVLEPAFGGYRPVQGEPPTRRRTRPSPLERKEYLLQFTRVR